ncbi:hypothetical protein BC829DRAFT_383074 [Chytridium lagenaria]|nr:hypothetical protein BC829DRAFT_383074 [Chytridium lagenaria]
MKQIRDQELSIEGNKVVEAVKPVGMGSSLDWAKEFNPAVTTKSWEEEFMINEDSSALPSDFVREFQEQQHRPHNGELNWASEFGQMERMKLDKAFQSYMNPQIRKEEARVLEWERDWENYRPTQYSYNFIPENPFISKPANSRKPCRINLSTRGSCSLYDALEAWLRNSDKYRSFLESANKDNIANRHDFLTEIFMQAARANAGHDLDATVQMALGAVDCFEASLSKQPQDYILWNKLGATLANSRTHERALDAYYNALQLNPAYIRARYNLAVSCIQLGTYKEAAEHILAALAIQEGNLNGAMESDGTSADKASTVRNSNVQRRDLIGAVDQRDLTKFKADFDF